MPLTTEQLIKIIGEGSYELGLHAGNCEVLEKLRDRPSLLTSTKEFEDWAKEEFSIQIK